MDFNHLYHRQGVSRLMADHAASADSRRAHHALAGAYAAQIRDALRLSQSVSR